MKLLIKHRVSILYAVLFLFWIFQFDWIKTNILFFIDDQSRLVQRISLLELAVQHIQIVVLASLISIVIALVLAFSVHLSQSKEYRDLILQFSTIGETLPTAAIIALSVPLMGYGNGPLLLALSIYGILPILRNTLEGLASIPRSIHEAALGLGLTSMERLIKIELPLALPNIFTGIRIATIINVSAATIGATVGAGGFGVMIVSGIRTYEPLLVVPASVPVILLALWFDRVLRVSSH